MKLQASVLSILVSIFRLGLLRLSALPTKLLPPAAAKVRSQSFATILTYVLSVW